MGIVSDLFADEIRISMRTAVSILTSYPASAAALAKIVKNLQSAERRRIKFTEKGVDVPPLMIISTTGECNLSCTGCYSCEQGRKTGEALPAARLSGVLDEASELGVSIIMLAGGEPLLSQNWLDAMSKHGEMLGLVFTNGTLFNESRLEWFAENRHIIPVLSIEGDAAQTDTRRGEGIHAKVNQAMEDLRSSGMPFGVSITVTRQNIDGVLTDEFNCEYLQKGCRLFIYVEYVPVEQGTEPLVLPKAEKKRLGDFTDKSAGKHPALFIAFPGNEEPHGGCLAAGRGFVHISAAGGVEPCPFAPFSDVNLKNTTLKDALNSALLARVRDNRHLLVEGDGGCALWHNRELLTELVKE